jgi:hypothetical protein
MALTAPERALYTARLADAEAQLHLVLTGQAARVFVDQNGERIEYTSANSTRLSAYIAELKRLLGLNTTSGPMNIWF